MRRGAHLAIPLIVAALAWLAPVTPAIAACNEFETVQSIVLSEAMGQSLPAKIEVARVAVTHGACNLDRHFWTGYGVAERVMREAPKECITNHHCRAYNMLYSIDPVIRESAAIASYIALTEEPRVDRWHVVSIYDNSAWMQDKRACPNGTWQVDSLLVC